MPASETPLKAFRWHADECPTLNADLVAAIFQGIRTCIARKPYIFVIFKCGGPDLDLHMLFHDILVHITCDKDSDESAQVCFFNTALMAQECQASPLLC